VLISSETDVSGKQNPDPQLIEDHFIPDTTINNYKLCSKSK